VFEAQVSSFSPYVLVLTQEVFLCPCCLGPVPGYLTSLDVGQSEQFNCRCVAVGTVGSTYVQAPRWHCLIAFEIQQPFNHAYTWDNSTQNMIIADPTISRQNTFVGSATQQATSVTTDTNQNCYEFSGGCYSVYGFEVWV